MRWPWQRELKRGPCYPILRAAAERVYGDLRFRGESLCHDCADRQPAAWWRLVYSVRGAATCSGCGRAFGVTWRAKQEHGELRGLDRAERDEMTRWAGRARA